MHVAVLGAGAVGARVIRQLTATPVVTALTLVDPDGDRAGLVTRSMGGPYAIHVRLGGDRWWEGADVAILAHAGGDHGEVAERLLADGVSVVSVSDDVGDVRVLLALDAQARAGGRTVVVGAGFAPGLSCLLAGQAAATFDQIDEVHVARAGAGGPDCARGHHHARRGDAYDWRDGQWVRQRGGSGRQLVWFPDPVGPKDCYRAAVPDPLVLVPAFPGVRRVTSRVAASRRDRVTAALPMLGRPRDEGTLGALRVEVRGRRGQAHDSVVVGAIDRPAVAAGAVAALGAVALVEGRLRRSGSGGLGELVDDRPALLSELARRGVKVAVFDGASAGRD